MKLTCEKKLNIRGRLVGGEKDYICTPLTGRTREEVLSQAQTAVEDGADFVEWRADFYENAADLKAVMELLDDVIFVTGQTPLIFTLRLPAEDGQTSMDETLRQQIIMWAAQSGKAALLDIESSCGEKVIEPIITAAHDAGTAVILSYHNFDATPSKEFIIDRLLEQQSLGADIAKVAFMANCQEDAKTLMDAAFSARSGPLHIPMIALSMGAAGRVTRLDPGSFGSDITYAVSTGASAPGQVDIEEVRKALEG